MRAVSKGAVWGAVIVLALVFAGGGYAYYRHESRDLRAAAETQLTAIARMKAGEIGRWRQEHVRDLEGMATGIVRTHVLAGIEGPVGEGNRAALAAWLERYRGVHLYQNVILARPDGSLMLSLDPGLTRLEPEAMDLAARAVASGRAEFGVMFRCGACGKLHLDVAAAIFDDERRQVAVLIQRNYPDAELSLLVQSWPTPSPSAESLLVRRDGDEVVFMNLLRHVSDPPLTRRIALSRTEVPAVQGALGHSGIFEGPDYRGVPVLSEVQQVPDSPWALVSKVDRDEILAEARYRGGVILVLVLLGVLLTAAAGLVAYRTGRLVLLQRLLEAEQARRQAQEEARTTLYSIGDGVISTDASGCVTRINPVAQALTGWSEAEARGQPLEQVFTIINEESRVPVESPVRRVLRDGVVVGLANHTLLVARDGTERPIADSGAPIRAEGEPMAGVVLVFRDQSEARQAEEALQTERDNLRAIMSATPVALVVFDEHERVLQANKAAESLSGGGKGALEQGRCGDFLGCAHRREDPDGCGRSRHCTNCGLRAAISEVLRTGEAINDLETSVEIESSAGRHDRWLVASVEPLVLGGRRCVVMALSDITGRKLAEDAVKASEERYRGLVELSPDAVFVNRDGQVTFVNAAALVLFGATEPGQLLGRSPFELFDPGYHALMKQRIGLLLEGQRVPLIEGRILRVDGTSREVEVVASPFGDAAGRAIQVILRDVTERKRLEEERRQFEAAARQQQRLEAIGTLASGVAHEINNPLNIILNYGELLRDNASDPARVADYAGNVIKESERVAVIVRNLLSFARQDRETHSPARVVDLVERTLSLMRAVLRKDHIRIEVDVPDDLPSLKCRSQQIQQVLMNLLTNARDALNQRYPGSVDDKFLRIRASVVDKDGHRCVRLSVEDCGTGIPAEVAERVFDPFFTTKPRDQGTGLGLSISYGIVREHHGELWFETEPDRGTTFHMDLPADDGLPVGPQGAA